MVVWVPNADVTYASGIITATVQTSTEETEGMIANGKAIMSRSDSEAWRRVWGVRCWMREG